MRNRSTTAAGLVPAAISWSRACSAARRPTVSTYWRLFCRLGTWLDLEASERRRAILSAATSIIASQGLGRRPRRSRRKPPSPTARLFDFDTKTTLLNELYIVLKTEMGKAASTDLTTGGEPRDPVQHIWTIWMRWATRNPQKRRALTHLEVAAEITAESQRSVSEAQKDMADVLERSRALDPMTDAPLRFVVTLASALADTAMDVMTPEPAAYSRRVRSGLANSGRHVTAHHYLASHEKGTRHGKDNALKTQA